jgi:hypothetical protein
MDIINTERFTIIDQKIVTVATSNGTSNAINLVGVADKKVNRHRKSNCLITYWRMIGTFYYETIKRIDQSER